MMRAVDLLERDDVLACLVGYAVDAARGAGRVVLLSGEAGVGKTSVVEALRERLPQARWLWGGCDGWFTPPPLGPVFDVAAQVGGALAEVCADADAPPRRIFRVVLDELSGAAAQEPTVLCIEDVHWADEATLDLLGFLVPRIRESRVMVVATYRDDGLAADHPLRERPRFRSVHRHFNEANRLRVVSQPALRLAAFRVQPGHPRLVRVAGERRRMGDHAVM